MKTIITLAALATIAGCSTTLPGTEIAGHPYRTDLDCERTEPIGEFDPKCDHPTLGWRGANTAALPSVGGSGGIGGMSVSGF